jgi:Flp pilus assembly protein TadB
MNDPLFLPRQSQGLFGRLLGFILTLALIVVGVMFSAVVLVIAAVAALAFWGWLRWKTRHLRQQMADAPAFREAANGVIEGEAVRIDEPPRQTPPPAQ